jgi:hypothetical protein
MIAQVAKDTHVLVSFVQFVELRGGDEAKKLLGNFDAMPLHDVWNFPNPTRVVSLASPSASNLSLLFGEGS